MVSLSMAHHCSSETLSGQAGKTQGLEHQCPTALECNAIAVVVTLTQVPVEKGFRGWDVTTLFLWPYKPGPSNLAYEQALKRRAHQDLWWWHHSGNMGTPDCMACGAWEPQPCQPWSLAQELQTSRTKQMMRGIWSAGSPPEITYPHTYIEYCGQKWEGCWTEFQSFTLWLDVRSYMICWWFFHHQYEDTHLYRPLWDSLRVDIYDVIIVVAVFICISTNYCSSCLISQWKKMHPFVAQPL